MKELNKHKIYIMCTRKKRFRYENQAYSKARDYGLDYYYCESCNGYHLTSQVKWRGV